MIENPNVPAITIAKRILLDPIHSVNKGGSFYHVLHDSVTLAAVARPSASVVILCLWVGGRRGGGNEERGLNYKIMVCMSHHI